MAKLPPVSSSQAADSLTSTDLVDQPKTLMSFSFAMPSSEKIAIDA